MYSLQNSSFALAGDDGEASQEDDDGSDMTDARIMKKPAAARIVAESEGDGSDCPDEDDPEDEDDQEGSEEEPEEEAEGEPEMRSEDADENDEWKNWDGVEEEYGGWFMRASINVFHFHAHA